MKKPKIKSGIKEAIRLTVPVMAGYFFLGLTFSLLAHDAGFAWWIPVLMSIVIYSGTLEFAGITILSAAFDPLGAFLLAVTLNARYMFYGIPMLKKFADTGKQKPFLIFGLTDETFSILSTTTAPSDIDPKLFYFIVTFFDYLYWNIGTVFGTILCNTVTVEIEGIDFVLTALFVVMFVEQVQNKSGLISGLTGLLASAAALFIFGSSSFVIIAMAVIIVILIAGRRVISHD